MKLNSKFWNKPEFNSIANSKKLNLARGRKLSKIHLEVFGNLLIKN
jgi:hypothetical protein